MGICSTTYGDLVCRGCKRFAHEIVSWNAYTPAQRERIESRLRELKIGALSNLVQVTDRSVGQRLIGESEGASDRTHDRISEADAGELLLRLYELWLQRPQASAQSLGLSLASGVANLAELTRRLEAECYLRARAYYERSFKVTTA